MQCSPAVHLLCTRSCTHADRARRSQRFVRRLWRACECGQGTCARARNCRSQIACRKSDHEPREYNVCAVPGEFVSRSAESCGSLALVLLRSFESVRVRSPEFSARDTTETVHCDRHGHVSILPALVAQNFIRHHEKTGGGPGQYYYLEQLDIVHVCIDAKRPRKNPESALSVMYAWHRCHRRKPRSIS